MAKYKIIYKLSHANGALVDESWDTSLAFEIGDGQLAPCLESCVEEAVVGKPQTFLLMADEAFGAVYDEAFQIMQRSDFPDAMKIEKYSAIEFKTPTGDKYVGCVDKIKGDEITINFNHSLAGCDLSFVLEVLEKS